jgi:hypothetical protein
MAMTDDAIDHDQLFKQLLSTFFFEFLELFFPQVAAAIDPDSITFLPQEYLALLIQSMNSVGAFRKTLCRSVSKSAIHSLIQQRRIFYRYPDR